MFERNRRCTREPRALIVALLGAALLFSTQWAFCQAVAPTANRQLGTVKSISADGLALATDAGQQIQVKLDADAKVVKLPAGSKDLKDAQPIELKDVTVDDRVLVRGTAGEQPGTFLANTIIVMKRDDLQQKRQQQQEDWQKRGIGGLVASIDVPAGAVTVSSGAAAAVKKTVIHVSPTTVIRKYSADSVKFEDTQPGTLAEIKPGDQLRARGPRAEDGSVNAEEIVSGSFLNIAGTVTTIDAKAGTLDIKNAATQRTVALKISADSQLRRLPAMMAQRMAARASGGEAGNGAAPSSAPTAPPAGGAPPANGMAGPQGGAGGQGRGTPDLQQVLGRLPKMPIDDLHIGDTVMIVATPGSDGGHGTVINLLAGVEAILAATPKGSQPMTLSPWNINGSPGDASLTQ
jgi:Domain of unknown function (DUF5666)